LEKSPKNEGKKKKAPPPKVTLGEGEVPKKSVGEKKGKPDASWRGLSSKRGGEKKPIGEPSLKKTPAKNPPGAK